MEKNHTKNSINLIIVKRDSLPQKKFHCHSKPVYDSFSRNKKYILSNVTNIFFNIFLLLFSFNPIYQCELYQNNNFDMKIA